jgi:uncharacterized membrane protein YhhN
VVNPWAWAFLVGAGVAAIGDWAAVVRPRKALEYVCKPLTLALLIGVAATIDADDNTVRAWFVAALVLSLLGDVFLMLPHDLFIAGLGSFLLAHVAFVVGLWTDGQSGVAFAIGLVIAAGAIVLVGSRILRAVRRGPRPAMAPPVAAYMTVISLMLASAVGTREPLAIGGAALFYTSDALIAWERFVDSRPWHRLAIIVTYHVAQAALTLSLLT